MVEAKGIALIEARRLLLLAQSEQLRQRFAAEGTELQAATRWMETGYSVARSLLGWWPLIATGIGFFATRKRKGFLAIVGRAFSAWRIAKRFVPLWKEFFPGGTAGEEASGQPP